MEIQGRGFHTGTLGQSFNFRVVLDHILLQVESFRFREEISGVFLVGKIAALILIFPGFRLEQVLEIGLPIWKSNGRQRACVIRIGRSKELSSVCLTQI